MIVLRWFLIKCVLAAMTRDTAGVVLGVLAYTLGRRMHGEMAFAMCGIMSRLMSDKSIDCSDEISKLEIIRHSKRVAARLLSCAFQIAIVDTGLILTTRPDDLNIGISTIYLTYTNDRLTCVEAMYTVLTSW